MKVHDSARKHGVDPDDAVHAAEHAVSSATWTRAVRHVSCASGSTRLAAFSRFVVLHFDGGNEVLIHAMKARRQYLDLLD